MTLLTPTGQFDRSAILRAAWSDVRQYPANHRRLRLSMAMSVRWAQAKQEAARFHGRAVPTIDAAEYADSFEQRSRAA